jgi:RHS repeat-associated protein
VSGPQAAQYTYDAAGNLVANGGAQFFYDARNRLAGSVVPLGPKHVVTSSYAVNALGQRVQKKRVETKAQGAANGGLVSFLYDMAGNIIGEYSGPNSTGTIQEIVYLGDTPLAVIDGGTTVYNVHTDQLNTPRLLTNTSDGATAWTWSPEPFGNTQPSGTLTFNLRFPGQYHDKETGLYHNGFRDYHPTTGRYIESDPVGLAAGLNTYAYVGNNPLVLSDPIGINAQGQVWGGALGGIAGAVIGGAFFGGPLAAPAGALIGAGLGVVAGDYIGDALSGSVDNTGSPNGQKMCSADDESEVERCKKVRRQCIEECSTSPPLGVGGRWNQAMPFHICVRQCIINHGCP